MASYVTVTSVRKEADGSTLASALTTSFTDGSSIAVNNVADFGITPPFDDPMEEEEQGGEFVIRNHDGTVTETGTYDGVDEATNTLLRCTRPNPLNWPVGSYIEAGNPADVTLYFNGYEGDDRYNQVLDIPVKPHLWPLYEQYVGVPLDEDDYFTVEVEQDGETSEIVAASDGLSPNTDQSPSVGGGSIAPGTVPAEALEPGVGEQIAEDVNTELGESGIGGSDGNVPATAATNLRVVGFAGNALLLICDTISNQSPVDYDFHVSTTTGFTPAANTLVGTDSKPGVTGGNAFFILRQFPSTHALSGNPLKGTTYFAKVVVRDVDGTGPTSSQASGTPVTIAADSILTAATIVGDLIAASTIVGDKIAANTITASRLLIGNFDNLVENPSFELGDVNWSNRTSNASIIFSSFARSGDWVLRFGSSGVTERATSATRIEVNETTEVYGHAFVRSQTGSTTGAATARLVWRDKTGAIVSSTDGASRSAITTHTKITVTGTCPAGAVTVELQVFRTAANDFWYVDDTTMRLRVGADLIVDGAITAAKLSVTDLSAISANLGTVTAGSLTGVTLTGGTVQTAASGARVEMTSTGLKLYDSSGAVTFDASTSAGEVTVTGGLIRTAVPTVGQTRIEISDAETDAITWMEGASNQKAKLHMESTTPDMFEISCQQDIQFRAVSGVIRTNNTPLQIGVSSGVGGNFLELRDAGGDVAAPTASNSIRLYMNGTAFKWVKTGGARGTLA